MCATLFILTSTEVDLQIQCGEKLCFYILGKSPFLAIELLGGFVFDHRTVKPGIFDHGTV